MPKRPAKPKSGKIRSEAIEIDYIVEPLRHLAVPLDSLVLDPANVRTHDERNLEAIVASLDRFGQRLPILVQKQGMVIRAGNGRVTAALQLGWTHIAAIVVDESDVEATAYAIADNRTAELADWDEEALVQLVRSLPTEIQAATGFLEADLDAMLESARSDDDGPKKPGRVKDQDEHVESYQVIAMCKNEKHQEEVYKLLKKAGVACRVSTLL